jgi:hypothetical protein
MKGFLRFANDSPLEQAFSAEVRAILPRFMTHWDAGVDSPLSRFPVVVHGDY